MMCPDGDEWPVGLSRPLADAGTLPRYAMGESVCAVARLRPELVGRAVLVAVQGPWERGASPGMVLRVGAPRPCLTRLNRVHRALPQADGCAVVPPWTLRPEAADPPHGKRVVTDLTHARTAHVVYCATRKCDHGP